MQTPPTQRITCFADSANPRYMWADTVVLRICSMFIVVKHGATSSLFNPDCSLVQLVVDIRKRCQCLSRDVGVALATDKCAIVHLSPEESLENASSLFVNRATYNLLAVHYREGEGEFPQYEALLDHIDHELAMKLDMLSNPNSVNQNSKSWNKSNRKSTKTIIQQNAPVTLAKTNKKTGSKNKIT